MPARWPWFERTWNFDRPVGVYPDVIERLRGTPARLEETVRGLTRDILIRRHTETWSIQENVGHLLTLEALPRARLDDFLAGAPALRAADVSNSATWEADHNAADIAVLLDAFRHERTRLVERLEALNPADFERTALHPRLQSPMRLVDMCIFHADHDDCHLARITELKRLFLSP